MNIENDVVENKGKIKMLELKMKALVKLLAKEGVVTTKEVEAEFNKLLAGCEGED